MDLPPVSYLRCTVMRRSFFQAVGRRHALSSDGMGSTGEGRPRSLARVTDCKIAGTLRRVVAESTSLGLVEGSE